MVKKIFFIVIFFICMISTALADSGYRLYFSGERLYFGSNAISFGEVKDSKGGRFIFGVPPFMFFD